MNKEAIKWSLSFLLLVATLSISAFLIVQNEELKRQSLTIKNEILSTFEKKNNVTEANVAEPEQKLETLVAGNNSLLIPITGKIGHSIFGEPEKTYQIKDNGIYRGSKKVVEQDLGELFKENSVFSDLTQFKKDGKIYLYLCMGEEGCVISPKYFIFDPNNDSYIVQTNNYLDSHHLGYHPVGSANAVHLFTTTTADKRELLGIYDIMTNSEKQLAIIDPDYTLFQFDARSGGDITSFTVGLWVDGITGKTYILVRPLPKKFGNIEPRLNYQ